MQIPNENIINQTLSMKNDLLDKVAINSDPYNTKAMHAKYTNQSYQ